MEDSFHFFPLWKRGMKGDLTAFQKAKRLRIFLFPSRQLKDSQVQWRQALREQKMKKFFSRRARRVRREDPRRNKIQDHAVIFWNFSFPVSPVNSSAAGERKAFAFG
jgi:hypothetical protein